VLVARQEHGRAGEVLVGAAQDELHVGRGRRRERLDRDLAPALAAGEQARRARPPGVEGERLRDDVVEAGVAERGLDPRARLLLGRGGDLARSHRREREGRVVQGGGRERVDRGPRVVVGTAGHQRDTQHPELQTR
jgi:hypothetical protein